MAVFMLILAACGGAAATEPPALTEAPATEAPMTEAPAATEPAMTEVIPQTGIEGLDQYGERYDADSAVLTQSIGTTEGVPEIALAAMYRAGLPVDEARQELAIKCWREKVCDTGTGGDVTVALADGFGENFWRQATHMEFILQALTYPEIGRIIYTTAALDTQKAISDIRSLIAQDVDIIVGFPDAGDALLPAIREAHERGIIYITHSYCSDSSLRKP
jgi:hypothetical protein